MDDSELRSLIAAEIRNSLGFVDTDINDQRADNIDRYLGEVYGDEIEGRSSVVSTDVMDTIEWIMPQLMRIFASGDNVVEFEPVGPEDEEADIHTQATDYVNHIFYSDNEGFKVLYTWFKDALITRTGL